MLTSIAETEADNPNSGNGRVLTSGTVTVTVTAADCSGGECSDAAQSSPPSTEYTDALTVLSNALSTPTPSNALVILSEAQGSFAVPVVPYTFAPALYSTYGLTGVATPSSVPSSQEQSTAPTPGAGSTPATYGATTETVASGIPSTTTTPIPIPVPTTETTTLSSTMSTAIISSSASTANPASSSAGTGSITTTTTSAPASPTSGVSSYGSSIVVPVGSSSTLTIPASATVPISSTEGASSSASSTGGSGASSQTGVTAGPAGTSTGSGPDAATTTAAPTNNFGTAKQPAAYGGLAAAVGALLFI